MKKIYAAIFLIVLVLVASAVYFFERESSVVSDPVVTLRYFSDEVVLVGKDLQGEDFFLDLQFPRKEMVSGKFQHFYTGNLIYNGEEFPLDSVFSEDLSDVKTGNFLKSHENKLFEDLSTRETYQFEIVVGDDVIAVELTGLEGDFITKNTLEYTRYLSVGKADVSVNGESFMTNAALEKSYSSDYSKYVYFDGYDDLKAEVYHLVVFDENGDFYLIDQADAKEDYENYKSHTWVLYKNAEASYSKKVFAADISVKDDFLNVNIPDLSVGLSFEVNNLTEGERTGAFVQGKLVDVAGERPVTGGFHYLNY